jgi:broad specificity phosphatase PhoE
LSTLTLIRHAQVASFESDGDRLSARGREQVQALAGWWMRKAIEFDEVYSGTLGRHLETERSVALLFADAGRPWPPAEVRPGWNEYDAYGVLHALAPVLAARDTRFAALVRAYGEAGTRDRNRMFQKMFEAAMLCWLEGDPAPGVEPWPAFRDRVREELARIVGAGGSGRRIAVFTSGGPIGVAVQTALAAPDRSFLEVNWRVRNCSVTEFVFGGGRLTLDSFNSLAHLEANLQTWR